MKTFRNQKYQKIQLVTDSHIYWEKLNNLFGSGTTNGTTKEKLVQALWFTEPSSGIQQMLAYFIWGYDYFSKNMIFIHVFLEKTCYDNLFPEK